MNMAVDTTPKAAVSQTQEHRIHLGWLNQVRGGAALYVVCHHAVAQILVVGDHAHDPLFRVMQLMTRYGHHAVDIFIVLSGYCLMLPLVNKTSFGNISVFYLRRTIRIALPYYGALLVSLIMIVFWLGESNGSHWASVSLPANAEGILKHLLLIHQWFPEAANKINPAFWSVGVEYQIYFLFPFFLFLARRFGFSKTFIATALISYALWGLCFSYGWLNPGSTGTSFYYCALFFMGMTAANFASHDTEQHSLGLAALMNRYPMRFRNIALSGLAIIAISGILFEQYFPLQIQSFFIGMFVAVLLYLKSRKQNSHLARSSPFLAKLEGIGTIGFSLYLLHDPVLALVWQFVVHPLNLPFYWMQASVELFVGLSASILMAWVFYKLVENPCHIWSKSIKTFP